MRAFIRACVAQALPCCTRVDGRSSRRQKHDMPERWYWRLAGYRVKGDGGARRVFVEGNRAVPHIGREQYQPAGFGLNGAAHGKSDIEAGLTELDPALFFALVFHCFGQRHIVARTDPSASVDVVGMKAAIA